MCDLHSAAEELRRIEAQVAQQFAAIPKPTAPDKPAETVENVSLAIGLATVVGVLAGVLS